MVNFKQPNICIIGVIDLRSRDRAKMLEEILTKTVPNLIKAIHPQFQEAQRMTHKRKSHHIFKLLKTSDKKMILKATTKIHYKSRKIGQNMSRCLSKTVQVRRQ